jgi:glycosyltransferase involved in cell wall biosynthesis
MRASVVIRSKDEASRLRLTLASLAQQTEPAEVVIVNDGSSDQTRAVISEAPGPQIVAVHHDSPVGRSAASNIGASRASGDILIFLDGDTLAAPDLVARHMAVHRAHADTVGRGETFHLRGTRFFADPESGTAMPGEEARVAALPRNELQRLLITRADIVDDFAGVDRRAQAGIYPGAGPRQLYEMEMAALRAQPDCAGLWIAASGSNQSVSRDAFLRVGGFDTELSINEHRELALRLVERGSRMRPVDGARTYHMTHRKGWRDPLAERDWEVRFYDKHSIPEVALMALLWAGFAEKTDIPASARIRSIPELVTAAQRCTGVTGIEAVRKMHLRLCENAAVQA